MTICKCCVLDESFPGLSFDSEGICNFCRGHKPRCDVEADRRAVEQRFLDSLAARRGACGYDCVVAFSGGKDSTYTLHLLRHRYHLRVLAFTFDNWFQSEQAQRNVRAVIKGVGVDHLYVTPAFDLMRRLIRCSVTQPLHAPKALVRASSICTSCITLIRYYAFRLAIEREIPFVVFGMSPGQAPLSSALVKTNGRMLRATQDILLTKLVEHVGRDIQAYFLEPRHVAESDRFPMSVNPLAFVPYDEDEIYRVADRYGWRKPNDTDLNSTNCLLNAFANHVHVEQFGYNPYAYEVAEMVRTGILDREEGLARLATAVNPAQVEAIRCQLTP